MIIFTAIFTGVLNILFFDTGLLGACGIVFMLILLSSITNYRNGDIPITFLLVVALYLGKEVMSAFETDQISQFGHIIGGVCGAVFGFIINKQQIITPEIVKPKPRVEVEPKPSKIVEPIVRLSQKEEEPEKD